MKKPTTARHTASSIRALASWALFTLCTIASQGAAALSVSPTAVALSEGTYVTAHISGANGSIRADSGNTAVATVTLSSITNSGATLAVLGQGAGNTTITIRDAR